MVLLRLLVHFFKNHLSLVVWLGLNFGIFWMSYANYKTQPQHYYLYRILGSGLCLSRGTAAVLNVNCALLLLPVCRSLMSFAPPALRVFVLAHAKVAHLTCSITVLFTAVIHSAAHLKNAYNFSRYYDHNYLDINVASYEGQDPLEMTFTSVPGWTGLIMITILIIMAISSIRCIRHLHFNFFSYTHKLGFVFLLVLIWHPSRGVLKEQTNIKAHIPGCKFINSTINSGEALPEFSNLNMDPCMEPPEFQSVKSQTWLWLLLPVVLYATDGLIRILRRNPKVEIQSANLHSGQIIHLSLFKKGLLCKPGQYVLLQCPQVSSLEWHPFTVSKCPSHDHPVFSLHIKVKGDWSCHLQDVLLRNEGNSEPKMTGKLRFHVDGPFSSPVEQLRWGVFPICIYIAGGIGITPYSAFFHFLIEQQLQSPKCPQRIHMIWVAKSPEDFLWFAPTLCQLHNMYWITNRPDGLELKLHVTNFYGTRVIQRILEEYPVLSCRVYKGRPNWKDAFQDWRQTYPGKKIGVFSCGPKSLNHQIRKRCAEENLRGSNFVFVHEAFS